jgi:hypothetical protein
VWGWRRKPCSLISAISERIVADLQPRRTDSSGRASRRLTGGDVILNDHLQNALFARV